MQNIFLQNTFYKILFTDYCYLLTTIFSTLTAVHKNVHILFSNIYIIVLYKVSSYRGAGCNSN